MPLSRQIHRSPHISHKGGHGIEYLYTGFEGEHKVELGQNIKKYIFAQSYYFKAFLKIMLPWQTNNTFIINENPPKMPCSAPICRSLPTIYFALRLLNLSQNKQNAAKRGKPGT